MGYAVLDRKDQAASRRPFRRVMPGTCASADHVSQISTIEQDHLQV